LDRRSYGTPDPNKRRANRQAGHSTERVKARLDARRADMAARYEAAVAQLCAMETDVRQVLNESGVQTTLYVSYLNFGRQLYKTTNQRGTTDESFALAACVLLEKWADRGLDLTVLARIRKQVLNAAEPTHVPWRSS
jgi:hypothetical protein